MFCVFIPLTYQGECGMWSVWIIDSDVIVKSYLFIIYEPESV